MKNQHIKEFFNEWAEKWDEYSSFDARLINEYIALLNIKNGDKIIDLACGTGVVTSILACTNAEKILAVDISENMIKKASAKIQSEKVEFVASDFLDLNVREYNSVIIYNAIPHFENRSQLAKKLATAIKSGGYLLICHGISRSRINNCHKNVMNISSHLHSPKEEFENFKTDFKLISTSDNESRYHILMQKI